MFVIQSGGMNEVMLRPNTKMARWRRMVKAARRVLFHMPHDVRGRRDPGGSQPAWRVVAVTGSPHTKIALQVAAFHQDWSVLITSSPDHARKLVQSSPVDILVYDCDAGVGNWRPLCGDSVERGIAFLMVASAPCDDLFLAAIAGGALGILWKPLTSEKLISAVQLARSLAEGQLARLGHARVSGN